MSQILTAELVVVLLVTVSVSHPVIVTACAAGAVGRNTNGRRDHCGAKEAQPAVRRLHHGRRRVQSALGRSPILARKKKRIRWRANVRKVGEERPTAVDVGKLSIAE